MSARNSETVRALREQGWDIDTTGRHPRATHPQASRPLTFSRSPSDRNATKAALREASRLLITPSTEETTP